MSSVSATDILNTILDNASDEYIERVPAATIANLAQVGQAITSTKNIMNEFVEQLVDKVALSKITSKMYHNPLEALKKGNGRPLGNTIEEIFINPSTDAGYDTDGTKLLKTTKPDGKAAYFGLNRQSSYPVSRTKAELQRAFSSERAFNSFYDGIVTSMFSGDQIDEFNLCKGLLAKNIDGGAIKTIEVDISDPKTVAKTMNNISNYFTFPSTSFCGYNLVNAAAITAKTDTPCMTFCPIENQVLLLRADVSNEINYEVLASMFHMEMGTLKAMTILVDNFPTTKLVSDATKRFDTYAVLCDREALQIIDDVFETDQQYIGSSMMWNMWLQHWQWLYLSMFADACAFGKTVPAAQ